MSTQNKIEVSILKLQLKVGSKITRILWYISNTGRAQISNLSKRFNEDEHELYFNFRRNTPEIGIIIQEKKTFQTT